ncbi:MAG: YbaB/EbfC family DNA-binding protein [Saprospirales bacterium]|jgi:DNA-binding protein YbaB|nr:MAG: YbaB/EbfC family DNA-binding protein [Saprospirales bacterium]
MLGDLMARMEGAKMEIDEKLRNLTITKSDSAKLVSVTVNGNKMILDLSISSELMEGGEPGLLEDVLVNVLNDALIEVIRREKEIMEEVAGGLMPPGLGL